MGKVEHFDAEWDVYLDNKEIRLLLAPSGWSVGRDEDITTFKDAILKRAEEINVITEYLKYEEYLAKWNGELPDVVAGDSATVVIPTPSA